jgi:hypothetical protein
MKNRDHLLETQKEYYNENREHLLEKERKYNINNCEKIKEKRKRRYMCECGVQRVLVSKARHNVSHSHINRGFTIAE